MKGKMLLGLGRTLVGLPRPLWQRYVRQNSQHTEARLGFMSTDHHRVRDLAVLELPRLGKPLPPEFIAQRLELPVERVNAILDDLERNLTFLFRGDGKAVTWAYPVTVDPTPHHLTFDTGEESYAAWAIDAIATPFVQGQLRGQPLTVVIRTRCAQSSRPLTVEMDSELQYRVVETGADPLIFVPMVDLERLQDPSIIDAF